MASGREFKVTQDQADALYQPMEMLNCSHAETIDIKHANGSACIRIGMIEFIHCPDDSNELDAILNL